MKDAFVAVHGHFYQPPRENPWLEALETEEGAHPFHDWNERITFECYHPNAHARRVDGEGKILDIVNNYASISFNFGPTLFPWLETKCPRLYQKIIEADRKGLERFGHGNALAQTYNHIIVPLANDRDKETEVVWGIADFERRFQRKPEAMWLPETAVNYSTLRTLVKHGMRYLILSPFQTKRVRPFGSRRWTDVSHGKVDPTQPYRCFLKDPTGKKTTDRFIDIFFYDGTISKDISFGDLLKDGEAFCGRFAQVYQESKGRAQLIHIATDGETYGHHKKFGEMALAYALNQGFGSKGLELINYGAFLNRFPPVYEAEIDEGPKGEGTSWSCAHGVGRWKEDCGCSTGGQDGWNQRWRQPLREALNFLGDELSLLFEREGKKIFKEVWDARNGYIRVILDRSPATLNAFFEEHQGGPLGEAERIKGLNLLELQRHALQMFTSCGWFFADLAGLETVLILQHAARAIQLAYEWTGQRVEEEFLHSLSAGQSNRPEMGGGDQVYRNLAKSKSLTLDKVVNHYALSSLFDSEEKERRIFSYRVGRTQYEKIEKGDAFLVLGEVNVTPEIIPEPRRFLFGLIPSKEYGFRTWVAESDGRVDLDGLKKRSLSSLGGSEEGMAQILTEFLGNRSFTIRDLINDEKRTIFQRLIQKEVDEHSRMYADLFDKTREVVAALAREGLEIPYEIRVAAEVALSNRLLREVGKLRTDFRGTIKRGECERIVMQAKGLGYHFRTEKTCLVLNTILREKMEVLERSLRRDSPDLPEKVEKEKELVKDVVELLRWARRWGLEVSKGEAQDRMAEMLDDCLGRLEKYMWGKAARAKPFPPDLIVLAEELGFNTDRFLRIKEAFVY